MLHLLYIFAFTVLAFLAVGNLIRNLLAFSADASRPASDWSAASQARRQARSSVSHPEMLDDSGNVIREPLLVMRSMTVEDARNQLDALYDGNNPSSNASSQRDGGDEDID
jgi:hypothetical protein